MINWFDMPAEGLSNGGLFEVKELEVTENGTYEQSGEMYNKVTVNVGGGGGSSVQTVTGTLANPWGDIDPTELGIAINNKTAMATMSVNAMSNVIETVLYWQNGLNCSGGRVSDADNVLVASAYYSPVDGSFVKCDYFENGSYMDVSSYASGITTTLTVVTLPSNNGGNGAA